MKANEKGGVLVEKKTAPRKKKEKEITPQASQITSDNEVQRSTGGTKEFLFNVRGEIMIGEIDEKDVKYRCPALNKENAVRKYNAWRQENLINKGMPQQSNRF